MRAGAAVCALIALAAVGFEARAQDAPPEPAGYRMDDYRSPTPLTLKGATVLSSAEAMALWKAKAAHFIDVMPRPRKPDNLPPQTLWHVPDRENIPGSIWLPNTGNGVLSPAMADYFSDSLKQTSAGDPAAPLVFYCIAACWMSWNAAKRALALGYSRVSWYPDGLDGWSDLDGPLALAAPVEPMP